MIMILLVNDLEFETPDHILSDQNEFSKLPDSCVTWSIWVDEKYIIFFLIKTSVVT